jgi:hypothetical protein
MRQVRLYGTYDRRVFQFSRWVIPTLHGHEMIGRGVGRVAKRQSRNLFRNGIAAEQSDRHEWTLVRRDATK